MKKYMDIQALRETDEVINGEIVIKGNADGFMPGDMIQITEKYDGSNASAEMVDGVLKLYSRTRDVTMGNSLNGFWEYAQERCLDLPEGIVVFGEWSGQKNKLVYEKKNEWFVFDIWDRNTEEYLPQGNVKLFCKKHGLEYIHELYYGPFISWDHCRYFMNKPFYGKTQEGIVVKNQGRLNGRQCFYLKLVNKEFKERIRKRVEKVTSGDDVFARSMMESIVTKARVEKMLFRMRDECVIPVELKPEDMVTVAKGLPCRLWEDCMKEEPEIVKAAGKNAGKALNSIAMRIARQIVTGE